MVNIIVIVASIAFIAMPYAVNATTTRSELVNRITGDLSNVSTGPAISSGAVLGQADSIPFFPRGFVYPIAELGNCDSKASCFEFCEQQENLELCAMVSYRNGTMSASQLKKTLTFAHYLRSNYFVSCNDLGSCAELCNDKNVRSECDVLALSLDQGIRVLGATDTPATENQFSLIEYCKNNPSCYNKYGSNNIMAAMDSLIRTGQAPSFCNNVEQCQEYCAGSASSECSLMYDTLSYMTGNLTPDTNGRVLQAIDNVEIPDTNNVDIPSNVTSGPIGYQPQGALSCIIDNQVAVDTNLSTDAQQADVFLNSAQNCDQEYGATQGQADAYGSLGKAKLMSGMGKIYDCVIQLENSADIINCL